MSSNRAIFENSLSISNITFIDLAMFDVIILYVDKNKNKKDYSDSLLIKDNITIN